MIHWIKILKWLNVCKMSAPQENDQQSPLNNKWNYKEYVSGAEKQADDLNKTFGGWCNKLTGEKDQNEKPEVEAKEKESSFMSQLSDIGTKSYGLINMMGKKGEDGKQNAPSNSAKESNWLYCHYDSAGHIIQFWSIKSNCCTYYLIIASTFNVKGVFIFIQLNNCSQWSIVWWHETRSE